MVDDDAPRAEGANPFGVGIGSRPKPKGIGVGPAEGPAPAVVLVTPQMGENIGTTARAMANFGLSELRLVAPRDGWPNERAFSAASGADWILQDAKLYETTAEAVADLTHLYATTARDRDMVKPVVTPRRAALEFKGLIDKGQKPGILFGPERTGLENDDVALAHTILSVPTSPRFWSLNLAQAVLLIGYEWHMLGVEVPEKFLRIGETQPATQAEVQGLVDHLVTELDEAGFLRPVEKKPSMVRNIVSFIQRAEPTGQDVRTFRGVVRALTRRYQRGQPKPKPKR
ncbi:RNA methyltransferase [Zavarzinia compransoris]|uniref:RNA methyltransferase n=1 Tax=Zavarzinia marina TaxID=2911065 RepID=UPI001F236867|nr:RNA methyltransferase [Zavarzinia marina]MCF4164408.1 RNA methyltransferase [Zavarzinia marina]